MRTAACAALVKSTALPLAPSCEPTRPGCSGHSVVFGRSRVPAIGRLSPRLHSLERCTSDLQVLPLHSWLVVLIPSLGSGRWSRTTGLRGQNAVPYLLGYPRMNGAAARGRTGPSILEGWRMAVLSQRLGARSRLAAPGPGALPLGHSRIWSRVPVSNRPAHLGRVVRYLLRQRGLGLVPALAAQAGNGAAIGDRIRPSCFSNRRSSIKAFTACAFAGGSPATWRAQRDSNPPSSGSKPDALSTEPWAQIMGGRTSRILPSPTGGTPANLAASMGLEPTTFTVTR